MGVKRRRTQRDWTVSRKLEVVQGRQRGLTLEELHSLYGVAGSTVSRWLRDYEAKGIAGLEAAPRGGAVRKPSAKVAAAEQVLAAVTQETPQAGVGRAQGALYRRGLLDLARETVRRILRRQGHGPILGRSRRRNKPAQVRSFERATPNELWQTDIMTFMLKGQYRVYLIGFMDDNSRFMVGWGLYRFQTTANVQEVFRAAIEKHGLPKEVLSDNGRQYYTWRGKSQFTVMLTKLGIRHIRSRPYHPQTLGKIESFWRNLLQECLSQVPLASFEEAQAKIGEYIEYYNFKRPHQGIGNLTPSDRFYRVGDQVRQIVEANTARMEEAQAPRAEYTPAAYIVGNIGGKELRVVAKDAEVSLRDAVEKIESGNGERGEHAPTVQDQAAQPAGAAGIDSGGPGATGAHPEPVPAGGGVAGAVLPVAEAGAVCRAQGAGGEGPGPQAHSGGEGSGTNVEAGGPGEASGGGKPGFAQGPGPLEDGGGVGAADHTPGGVGPCSPGTV